MILDASHSYTGDHAAGGTGAPHQGPITATALSRNVIDHGVAEVGDRQIGRGNPQPINIQVTVDFDNLTSLAIALETDADANFGAGQVVLQTTSILLAALVAGKKIPPMMIPTEGLLRYTALRFTVTGSAPTAGSISAWIGDFPQNNPI